MSRFVARCTPASLTAVRGQTPNLSCPDILRKEHFGGFFYRRKDCKLMVLRPETVELLEICKQQSAVEWYARLSEASAKDDEAFAKNLAIFQADGFLGEDFKCHAQFVDNHDSKNAFEQVIGAPLVTNVELTNRCNLRCAHCYLDLDRAQQETPMSAKIFDRLFGELASAGAPLVVLAGGEPLVRKDLLEIVQYGEGHGMDMFLCTNGTLINKKRAHALVQSAIRGYSISLDGPDEKTHDAMRGDGSFDAVICGIENLLQAGAKEVAVRFTLTKQNMNRLLDIVPLVQKLGVHKVSVKQFNAVGAAKHQEQLVIQRDVYETKTKELIANWPTEPVLEVGDGMPSRPPDWTSIIPRFGCVGANTTVTITADGRVLPCSGDALVGDWNIQDRSFLDCWRNSPFLQSWREITPCQTCAECSRLSVCGGGCRARALGQGGSLSDPDPFAADCPAAQN